MKSVERKSPRFEFDPLPWVFTLRLHEAAPAEQPFRLEARNISRGGAKFTCNRKIPLFEQVQIVLFDKATGKEAATVFGKVVRLEDVDVGLGERTYGIAVEFIPGTTALHTLLPEKLPEDKAPGT